MVLVAESRSNESRGMPRGERNGVLLLLLLTGMGGVCVESSKRLRLFRRDGNEVDEVNGGGGGGCDI